MLNFLLVNDVIAEFEKPFSYFVTKDVTCLSSNDVLLRPEPMHLGTTNTITVIILIDKTYINDRADEVVSSIDKQELMIFLKVSILNC